MLTRCSRAVVPLRRSFSISPLSEETYYRWRNQFGGMKAEEAKRLKELELENVRLKRLVVNQALDIAILTEANDYLGKPQAPRGGGRS